MTVHFAFWVQGTKGRIACMDSEGHKIDLFTIHAFSQSLSHVNCPACIREIHEGFERDKANIS